MTQRQIRGDVLNDAIKIINGERQDQYGNPEDSFEKIAALWSEWLCVDLKNKDVAMMMVLLKIARERNQYKRDNIIDAAGYLGIYADCQNKEV